LVRPSSPRRWAGPRGPHRIRVCREVTWACHKDTEGCGGTPRTGAVPHESTHHQRWESHTRACHGGMESAIGHWVCRRTRGASEARNAVPGSSSGSCEPQLIRSSTWSEAASRGKRCVRCPRADASARAMAVAESVPNGAAATHEQHPSNAARALPECRSFRWSLSVPLELVRQLNGTSRHQWSLQRHLPGSRRRHTSVP